MSSILRSSKTRFTQGRLFYTQGSLFCAAGPLFCSPVREGAIFPVCERCENEGFACMCKEKNVFDKFRSMRHGSAASANLFFYYILEQV